MDIYLKLFEVLFPVFFIVSIGVFLGKKNPNFDTSFITTYSGNFGTPALVIFALTAGGVTFDIFKEFFFYGLILLTSFGIVGLIFLIIMKKDYIRELPTFILPNTGNMGIPICLFAYGELGMGIAAAISSLVVLLHFTLNIFLAKRAFDFITIFKSPAFYAIIVTVLLLFFEQPIPQFVMNTVMLLAYGMIVMILMSLGVALTQMKVFSFKDAVITSTGRVILGPIIGFALIKLFNLSGVSAGVVLIQSAMPSAILCYLVASMYSPKVIVDNITSTIANATSIGINTFAYGQCFSDPNDPIRVRINAVLGKYDITDNTYYYSKGDTAKIRTLGVEDTKFKSKNWFYNVAPSYKVKSVKLLDSSDLTYEITLSVNHYFRIGDAATLIDANDAQKITSIINIPSAKSIVIRGQGNLNLNTTWDIKRNILTVNSSSFPSSSLYTANIQNVYKNNSKLLVASPSLPSYDNQPLDVYSQTVTFTGTYIGEEWNISPFSDHGFYTGEIVYYIPEKVNYEYFTSTGTKKTGVKVNSSLFAGDIGYIVTGLVGSQEVKDRIPPNEKIYIVYRVDANNIKLAQNITNISTGKFISLDNSIDGTN